MVKFCLADKTVMTDNLSDYLSFFIHNLSEYINIVGTSMG
jgi:hypothetical protein